jgi:hypothetical protein
MREKSFFKKEEKKSNSKLMKTEMKNLILLTVEQELKY